MKIEATKTDYLDEEFPSFEAFRAQYPEHEPICVDDRIVVAICVTCRLPILDAGQANGVEVPADAYEESEDEMCWHTACGAPDGPGEPE